MYGKSFKQERIADQTVRYIRIIETLKGADYTAAIAALNATELFAELSEAQTMYEDLLPGTWQQAIAESANRRDAQRNEQCPQGYGGRNRNQ